MTRDLERAALAVLIVAAIVLAIALAQGIGESFGSGILERLVR